MFYPVCKTYCGVCEYEKDYLSETKRKAIKRWSEHDNPTKDFEQARYLNKHIKNVFTWNILYHVSKMIVICKNLETIFIALLKPSLNEQQDFECFEFFFEMVSNF